MDLRDLRSEGFGECSIWKKCVKMKKMKKNMKKHEQMKKKWKNEKQEKHEKKNENNEKTMKNEKMKQHEKWKKWKQQQQQQQQQQQTNNYMKMQLEDLWCYLDNSSTHWSLGKNKCVIGGSLEVKSSLSFSQGSAFSHEWPCQNKLVRLDEFEHRRYSRLCWNWWQGQALEGQYSEPKSIEKHKKTQNISKYLKKS